MKKRTKKINHVAQLVWMVAKDTNKMGSDNGSQREKVYFLAASNFKVYLRPMIAV
jgi:hypothetical protein